MPGDEFEESYSELKDVFEGEEYVQDYIDSTEFGELISVYKPIKNSSGDVVAILGCDYDAKEVSAQMDEALVTNCFMTVVFILVAVIILSFIVSKILKGLKAVNSTVYDLVHSD